MAAPVPHTATFPLSQSFSSAGVSSSGLTHDASALTPRTAAGHVARGITVNPLWQQFNEQQQAKQQASMALSPVQQQAK